MRAMFRGATRFNRDLSHWDVSQVTSFQDMFRGATSFNRDLGDWPVSPLVTSIGGMFNGATSFSQDLCAWGLRFSDGVTVDGAFARTSCPLLPDPDFTQNPPSPFCNACFAPPTTSSTASPTKAPSATASPMAPTISPVDCPETGRSFSNSGELKRAIESYMADPSGRNTCLEYGHPIGNWDVSRVFDFNLLFSQGRNTFNEDVSDWVSVLAWSNGNRRNRLGRSIAPGSHTFWC